MKRVLKISLYIIGIVLLILIAAIAALNTPWGQNIVRSKAEAFLQKKLKTEVRIGHLGYGLPKFIVINDVLIKDQAKDTLLSVNTLKVDLAMLELLNKKLDIQLLVLKGVHAHVYRNMPDTNFNFTYIIAAFAGNPKESDAKKDKKSTGSAFTITVGEVRIDDIHARFDDATGGIALSTDLEHLSLEMKKLDLDKMLFHIKELRVAGLKTTFNQDTSYLAVTPKTNKKTQLQLIADNVHLERIKFKYNNDLGKLLFALDLGELQLALKKFDLAENIIDINKLAIINSGAMLSMGKNSTQRSAIDTIAKTDTTDGWHIKVANVDLSGLAFKMDDENATPVKKGIDYAHLDLKEIALNANDLSYATDSISGNIKHLSAREKSGINVQELKTAFIYNDHGAKLNNLYLLTPHTLLRDHLEVHYSSLATLKDSLGKMQLNIDVDKSLIGFEDILAFAPQLIEQDIFRKYPKGQIRLDARANGLLGNLNIARLYVLSMNNTEIELNGKMTGLPDPEKLKYNLHITKLQSSRKEVEDFVPASALTSVRVPDRFGLTGDVLGTIKDYYADVMIISTDGSAYVKGSLALSPGKGKERYNMLVQTNKLNIGRILKRDTLLGEISTAITVVGTGFDIKTMNTAVNGAIGSAVGKDYRYHDILFSGNVSNGKGAITLSSADVNLRMHMTGSADFGGKTIAAKTDIQLDSIDLQALKFYKTELRARGTIHADFPSLDPDYPKGIFTWTKPIINADGKRYYLDSMYIISAPDETKGQDITAYFDVLSAHITGKTPLTKIGSIMQQRISKRYTPPVADTAAVILLNSTTNTAIKSPPKDTTTIPEQYRLKLTATLVDKPMLHSIVPGLTEFDSIHIDGNIDKRSLMLNVDVPRLVYGSNTIQKAILKVNGTDTSFTYRVTVDKIASSGLSLWYADVHGNVEQNLITANISIADSLKKERFALAANMQKDGDQQVVTLKQGLKLNYNIWDVTPDNKIVLTNNGYYIQNFSINNSGQYIKANSVTASPDALLKIDVTNFLLSNITSIANAGDTILANGVLGATVTMQKTNGGQQINGDIEILDLSVLGDTMGNLKLLIDNKNENILNAKIALTGKGNDISIDGTYYLQPKNGNDFDLQLEMKALALHSFESFTLGQLKKSSGFVRGSLHLTGTPTAPVINGDLRTDNLRTTVAAINSNFKFPAEKIKFSDNLITLINFTILDSPDNKATLTGTINTKDLTEPVFDLKVKAKNWRAIHSTIRDNKDFFGDLVVTTDLDIKGTPLSPHVDGSLNILKGTDLTIITPEKTPEIESSKGIVKFVSSRDNGRKNLLIPKKKEIVQHKLAKGSDINVNIVVDKSAKFSLVIDQASGDFISVRGDATLNASVARNGTIGLTGNYALHDGAYQLNYNFIKRKFLIKEGSNIIFAGDPINGTNMDVTAVYEANVPPYDLIQRQVTDQAALNYYKQRIPFDVELHLKGPILKPGINFDLNLPEGKVYPLAPDQIELIQGKLSQIRTDTSELNKQVFAVLILNRFVSDDPFSSKASSSVGFTALQSVSTFIGEQLNKAANNFVKGVDFSVDLATTEDYTTGDLRQRTDLNLAASKQLFNDRLKLTIGNNFELEGPQTANQQNSYVPTNLAADYLLSADGKYTVRGYRKAYDEGVLEGFVTETGVNFIVSLDYNNFKSVLKKKKKIIDSTTNQKRN